MTASMILLKEGRLDAVRFECRWQGLNVAFDSLKVHGDGSCRKQFDASFPLGKIARSIWTEPTILQFPANTLWPSAQWKDAHRRQIADTQSQTRWPSHMFVCVWDCVPFSIIFTMLHFWALCTSKQTYFDILKCCEACLWLPCGISIDGCRTSLLRDFNSWLVARLATCGLTVRWFWRLAWCFHPCCGRERTKFSLLYGLVIDCCCYGCFPYTFFQILTSPSTMRNASGTGIFLSL